MFFAYRQIARNPNTAVLDELDVVVVDA